MTLLARGHLRDLVATEKTVGEVATGLLGCRRGELDQVRHAGFGEERKRKRGWAGRRKEKRHGEMLWIGFGARVETAGKGHGYFCLGPS